MSRIILIFILALSVFSNELTTTYEKSELEKNTQENRGIQNNETKIKLTKTYKEATGDEDTKDWNMQDWKNNFNTNGANTGAIGRMQTFWGQSPGAEEARSGNPNLMRNDYLQVSPTTKDINSIKSWNNEIQETLKASTLNGTSSTITGTEDSITCYITRDIPISYKCNLPDNSGLLYGGEIGESGEMIKKRCENECFEQRGCVEINHNPIVEIFKVPNMSINTTSQKENEWIKEVITKKENLNSIFKMDFVSFDVELDNNATKSKIYIDFSYIDRDYKEVKLLDRYHIYQSGSQTIPINSLLRSVTIKLYTEDTNVSVTLKNITYTYVKNGRYICQAFQDITTVNPGEFAKLCPSGNIVDIQVDNKSYKICSDYGVVGDNADGTFSTLDSCNAICKKNYDCSLEMGSITIDALKSFREGCIAGQEGCTDQMCKDLRINGALIIEENVFDAGQHPRRTVISGTQVPGVDRPRPNADQDLEYDKLLAEEYKDQSWKNMQNNNTYRISKVALDENTISENAFAIGINNNASYGYMGIDKRAGYWIHKPDALKVDDGATYKFYVVLDVITQRKDFNDNAQLQTVKDRIMYVKTNANDTFKPFARKLNYAYNNTVANEDSTLSVEHSENKTAHWKYESFDNGLKRWYTIGSNLILENFISEQLHMEVPVKRRMIINNINELYFNLPGIRRSIIKNGPYETPVYDGIFDGTGDVIARYAVHVYYTKDNVPTYQSIIQDIENGINKPIYDNLSANAYSQNVVGEASDKVGDNIVLYLYGNVNKKTGFLTIKPREQDIGKYGHIFIRALE